MTEEDWLTCPDPEPMMRWMGSQFWLTPLKRRLRLFVCAGCRLLRGSTSDTMSDAIEDFVEGPHTVGRSLHAVLHEAHLASYEEFPADPTVECHITRLEQFDQLHGLSQESLKPQEYLGLLPLVDPLRSELADLVREIIGNPFRRIRFVNGSLYARLRGRLSSNHASDCLIVRDWLYWKDRTVQRLAEAIATRRMFQDMPILADALEEAVCDNAEVLGHLLGPGPHFRGCWVLDLLRGRL